MRIEGRAKRFAKIGGEMISLAPVEALASDLRPGAPCAVLVAPDARKGERLVLLTEEKAGSRGTFPIFARSRGASDLMVPSEVLIIEHLPLLGTGKTDYAALPALLAMSAAASFQVQLSEKGARRLAMLPPNPETDVLMFYRLRFDIMAKRKRKRGRKPAS